MLGGSKKPESTRMGKKPKSIKALANEHEQELADKLPGGRRQPMSGALEGRKGDVILDHFLLDSKQTIGSTLVISGKDFTKITREADGEGKFPALVLTIPQVPATVSKEWVTIPIDIFARMVENGQDVRAKDGCLGSSEDVDGERGEKEEGG